MPCIRSILPNQVQLSLVRFVIAAQVEREGELGYGERERRSKGKQGASVIGDQ